MNAGPTPRRLCAAAALTAMLCLAACRGEEAEREANKSAPPPNAPIADVPSAAPPGALPLRRPERIKASLLPPGAVIGADPDAEAPALVFQAREAPADLLDWFRATGNGADFVLESEMQEGAEHVFSGRVRESGEAYSVRIAPGGNGGTTGTIVIAPR